MVKDINSGSSSGSPYDTELTAVGNTLYFRANDGTNGTELWKSDGTASGTVMVKDINSGSSSSSPNYLTAVGNTLYFAADNGTNGTELWKSDGTSLGTIMVKDIWSGNDSDTTDPCSADPSYITAFGNDSVLFSAMSGSSGNCDYMSFMLPTELWISNGTQNGTFKLNDIYSENDPNDIEEMFIFNSTTVFFRASYGASHTELWKTNGTTSGTMMVKDIYPGAYTGHSGNPQCFAIHNGLLYFRGTDAAHGNELWKSDGTESGTTLVDDINNGAVSSNPCGMVSVNGLAFITAYTTPLGTHLRSLII
jgi:ELWxxDGT repeat protein